MKTYSTTIGHLYDIEQEIIKSGVMNMSFSRKGSFSIARNLKKLTSELETYKEERANLIKQYSGDSDSINPENPRWNEFYKEYLELSNVDVSVEINTISEEDFPEQCTPMVYTVLDFMTEDNIKED